MADEKLSFPKRVPARPWTRALRLLVLAVAGIGCSAAGDSQVQVQPNPEWLEFREVAHKQSAAFPIEVTHRFEREDGTELASTYYTSETTFFTAVDVRTDEVHVEEEPDGSGKRITISLRESGRERMRRFTTDNDGALFGIFVRSELVQVVAVNSIVDAHVIYLRGLPTDKVGFYHSQITGLNASAP